MVFIVDIGLTRISTKPDAEKVAAVMEFENGKLDTALASKGCKRNHTNKIVVPFIRGKGSHHQMNKLFTQAVRVDGENSAHHKM